MSLLVLAACFAPASRTAAGAVCAAGARVTSFDGTTLAADCYDGTGRTLVLIHGWSQSKAVWTHQIAALSGQHRLITYDLRGHGESDRPTSEAAFVGEWTAARDLAAVLDHFAVEDPVIPIGWSFGSIVAVESAAYLGPERVAGLVLVSGTIEAGTQRNLDNFGQLMASVPEMTQGGEGDAEAVAVQHFLRASYLAGSWDPSMFRAVFDANMSLSPAERSRVALRPKRVFADGLNRDGTPVLLLHGRDDNVFKASSSIAAHEELNHSTLILYEQTGHWPFIERHERFNRDLLAFIQSTR